jgi:hypothetical protein
MFPFLIPLLIIGIIMSSAIYVATLPATPAIQPSLPTPDLPVVATAPITQNVGGNNGSVSCNTYCKGTGGLPWNNELPVDWNGAKCVSTDNSAVGCDDVANSKGFNSIGCVCAPTGLGWSGKDSQEVYGNNGSVSCNTYCGGTGGAPWNNELPVSWNGATCSGTNNPAVGCDDIANSKGFDSIGCVCIPSGTGWK